MSVVSSAHHQRPLPPVPGIPSTSKPEVPRRIPRTAVASLVFGLMAFFTLLLVIGIFPAVLAVIFGHVAMNRIRHSNGRLGGHGVAMSGVILGYVTLVGTSAVMLLILVSYHPASRYFDRYLQQQSMRNASRLYLASEAYARDHKGTYPKTWKDLEGRYVSAVDLKNYLKSVHTFRRTGNPAFRIVPHQRPVLPAVASQVVVIQEIAPPDVDLITVVYADGNTEQIANPDRAAEP